MHYAALKGLVSWCWTQYSVCRRWFGLLQSYITLNACHSFTACTQMPLVTLETLYLLILPQLRMLHVHRLTSIYVICAVDCVIQCQSWNRSCDWEGMIHVVRVALDLMLMTGHGGEGTIWRNLIFLFHRAWSLIYLALITISHGWCIPQLTFFTDIRSQGQGNALCHTNT